MSTTMRILIRRSFSLLLLLAAIAITLFQVKPLYNWDMIPYIGVALSYQEEDVTTLHSQTYASLTEALSARKVAELTTRDAYRQRVFSDAAAFEGILPFYSVKPVYPFVVNLLVLTGQHPVDASVIISRTFTCVLLMLFYFWIRRGHGGLIAGVVTLLIAMTPFLQDLAGYLTPDAMSAATVFAGLYLLMVKKQIPPALMLLAFSVLVRPDNLILVAVLSIFLLIRRERIEWVLIASFLALNLYLLSSISSGNGGWQVLMHHSFGAPVFSVETFSPYFTLQDYLTVYKEAMLGGLGPGYFPLILALVVVAAVVARATENGFLNHMMLALAGYCVLHWLAFPIEKERQLVAVLLVAIAVIMSARKKPYKTIE